MQAVATEQELSDFLKNTEKRAFKRTLYHVRNEESALDIVQDSMIKLATHYGDKPQAELPLLFQRILSNTTLDWFRRQKTRNALFSNMSDFGTDAEGEQVFPKGNAVMIDYSASENLIGGDPIHRIKNQNHLLQLIRMAYLLGGDENDVKVGTFVGYNHEFALFKTPH